MHEYRRTNTTVFLLKYHFIFCPKYRRKIFLIDGVEERFKGLIRDICFRKGYNIIALECDKDHCHLFVSALPTVSPDEIMKNLKGITSKVLRDEFKELSMLPKLWSRSYFVSSAGDVSSETVRWYINTQKTRKGGVKV